MTNLKPCPFCGGEAQMKRKNFSGETRTFYKVECIPDENSIDLYSVTAKDAAENWNTRTESPDLTRLYEWITNPNREPAQTAFTAGIARDIAREVEMMGKPKPQPPVLEWEFKETHETAKCGKYDCMIVDHEKHTDVFCRFNGNGFFILSTHKASARLAAENAVLRHWIENNNYL